jgi:hypothetical protein
LETSGYLAAKPSNVKMYLQAASAKELVRLQLQTNLALMGQAVFTDIQFVDGSWFCWYLVDVDQHPEVLEGLNDAAPGS